MSTARVYIFAVLERQGLQCPKCIIASRYQLFMVYECCTLESSMRDKFSDADFDISLSTARESMRKIFDELFKYGVTLGRAIAMCIYGAMLSVKLLNHHERETCLLIPNWIDDYIYNVLKPQLVLQDRWQYYAPLFNLL